MARIYFQSIYDIRKLANNGGIDVGGIRQYVGYQEMVEARAKLAVALYNNLDERCISRNILD